MSSKQIHDNKCHLCQSITSLKESHIIPKCLSKEIRKIDPDLNMKNPHVYTLNNGIYNDKYKQDTIKPFMLCSSCEQKFSALESYFCNNFSWNVYNEKLYKFIMSIFWRINEYMIYFSNDKKIGQLYLNNYQDLEELRKFLNNDDYPLEKKPLIYLFKIESGSKYDFNVHTLTYLTKFGIKLSIFAKYKDNSQPNLLYILPKSKDHIEFHVTQDNLELGFSIQNYYEYQGINYFAIVSSGIVFLIQPDSLYIPDCPSSSIISYCQGKWSKNILPTPVLNVLNSYGRQVNYDVADRSRIDCSPFDAYLECYLNSTHNMKSVMINLNSFKF